MHKVGAENCQRSTLCFTSNSSPVCAPFTIFIPKAMIALRVIFPAPLGCWGRQGRVGALGERRAGAPGLSAALPEAELAGQGSGVSTARLLGVFACAKPAA